MKRTNSSFSAGFTGSLCFTVLFLLNTVSIALAQETPLWSPKVFDEIGVSEKLGETVPADVELIDANGNTVRLGELMQDKKPVILNLAYYECPMLCSLVMNGMLSGLKDFEWTPGVEYEVLTVSIDPRETSELALQNQIAYRDSLGLAGDNEGWKFFTAKESEIWKLAQSIGFKFRYDNKIDQYAHPAAITFLSGERVITRYIYGIEFQNFTLKNALSEAAEGKIGTTVDRIILYCFQYDPSSNSYVPVAKNTMKIGGGVIMVALGLLLGILWYNERKKVTQSI